MTKTSGSAACGINDSWVEHPRGRMFVRTWTPASDDAADGAARQRAPVVLFHDSLGCVELWREFPEALCVATGRRVIAYDRLGFGRSDARDDVLALDFVADEACTYFPVLREQLGIGHFVGFGHSVGGGMAIHCAAAFPATCDALVTVAAQVFPEDRTLQGIVAAKAQFQDAAQVERLAKYHGAKARWVLDAWTEIWLHPAFASWSLAAVLPKVVCPVLAIHGIHDEYGSPVHPEMIGELSGGLARVEIIPDARHMPHREQPELIVGMIADFLAAK